MIDDAFHEDLELYTKRSQTFREMLFNVILIYGPALLSMTTWKIFSN